MKGGLIGMLAAAILLTPIATAAQNYDRFAETYRRASTSNSAVEGHI